MAIYNVYDTIRLWQGHISRSVAARIATIFFSHTCTKYLRFLDNPYNYADLDWDGRNVPEVN